MRGRTIIGIAFALGLVGCGQEEISISLDFPSRSAFLRIDLVRTYVVPLPVDRADECSAISMKAAQGDIREEVVFDSQGVAACEFFLGTVTVPKLDGGLHAYVAVGTDAFSNALLNGCAVRDLDSDAAAIVITMATTDRFRTMFPAGSPPPACPSPEDRCAGNCQ